MKDMLTLQRTEVFGHRGWSARYPENTMAAFISALEIGVDGIEFDVHLTKDGEIVVIHDANLERTTNGHGCVEDYTLTELRQLDAGSWFHESFRGQVIPTLDEVLELVRLHIRPVKMNIELKYGRTPYAGLGENVWRKVTACGLASNTIISSFNHFALRDLKRDVPQAQVAILYTEGLVDPWRYAVFLDAEGLHPFHQSFDEEVVLDAHRAGRAVRPYTVNDVSIMKRLIQ
ncbi:glycerophosphodiester phosphodiesterase [Alicyclobacillus ferrooxydans]|nr:glycerophosphodiester phosphodiesterase [Alicyclobacillus ferrooxydans]